MHQHKMEWIIFIGLLLAYGYVFPHWLDWNQNSRFDLVRAIVEQNRLSIDDYVQNTGDYSTYAEHAYSDKAPGLSLLAVPLYSLSRPFTAWPPAERLISTLGRSQAAAETINRPVDQIPAEEFTLTANILIATLLTVAVPSAALAVVMFRFFCRLGYPPRVSAIAVMIYSLATTAFPYSAAFYGHQLVAVLLFSAFAWLYLLPSGGPGKWTALAIGGLMGSAILVEIPAVPLVAVLAGYALWRVRRPGSIGLMALGGLGPLIVLGGYNLLIFGTPFAVAYAYSADPLWHEHFNTGLLSLGNIQWEALWGMTFGLDRGLFFVSPIWLAMLPGFVLIFRRAGWRAAGGVSLAMALALWLVLGASSEWYGGYAAGPRYLVPILPFLVWPLAATLTWIGHRRPGLRRLLSLFVVGLVLVSIAITWTLTLGGQYYAPDDVAVPVINYSWPRIVQGDVARNIGMLIGLRGGWSLLPLVVWVTSLFGVVWHLTSRRRMPVFSTESAHE